MRTRTGSALVLGGVLVAASAFAASPLPTPTPPRVVYPGALDRTFGVGGHAAPPAGSVTAFTMVALDPGGKIVVGGNVPHDRITVLRYDPTGHLDQSFGDGGGATTTLPHGGGAYALAVTNDGGIVLAGYASRDPAEQSGADLAVIRFDADGTLDADFAGGVVTFDAGKIDGADAVLVQGDARIIAVGDSNDYNNIASPFGSMVIVGYRPDGTLDPTFGTGGVVRIESLGFDFYFVIGALIEPNGDLLVAATLRTDIYGSDNVRVIRLDHDGHGLEDFDRMPGFGTAIARATDGTLVVSGGRYDSAFMPYPTLSRWNARGQVDERFGAAGEVVPPELASAASAIAVDEHGRIVVADTVLARHVNDGTLDTSFGVGGVATGLPSEEHYAVALQPDGKIVVAGHRCEPSGENTVCAPNLARYESDRTEICGDPDQSGALTVTDGVAILRFAADLPSRCTPLVCDIDGDGRVTVTDAVVVLRAAAALPATVTCGVL